MEEAFSTLGLIASASLPLFNIPLMRHMIRRKSSADLSMVWVWGVFFCSLFMLPQALISKDITLRVFGIVNISCFSGVTFLAAYYRKNKGKNP
jgi:uncharacterized protein with PQ loop repeat